MRAPGQSPTLGQRLQTTLGRGPLPYIITLLYTGFACFWLIMNPASTLAFLLFLSALLVVYYLPTANWFKMVIGAIILIGVMPYVGNRNPGFLDNITFAAIFAALALGLNIVVGFAGLLDLGYVAFFAIGAYFWAILSTPLSQNVLPALSGSLPLTGPWFFLIFFLSIGVAALGGVLLGLPVLRLRGDYLAIVTLGFGEVIRILANNLNRPVNITGGAQGVTNIGQPPMVIRPILDALPIEIAPGNDYRIFFYLLALLLVVFTIIAARHLSTSRVGRAWTAIREDETAAIAMGVPLVRMKLLAFACGASFAGAMGVLYAAKLRFISPPTFDVVQSISILAMVILGGMGSIPGALLGAVLVTLLNLRILPDFATQLRVWRDAGLPIPQQFNPVEYQRLFFGLILILMMIFRPEGLLPEQRRRAELHHDAEEGEEMVEDEQNLIHPEVGMKS